VGPEVWSSSLSSHACDRNRCHELRIRDRDHTWRILYRVDRDAILILDIFDKKTATTPKTVIEDCRRRLRHYDQHVR